MKYLIWKRKILEPNYTEILDTIIINTEENWYYTMYSKEDFMTFRKEYNGIRSDLFDKIYKEFMYYKLNIDDKYIEALKY